MAPRKLRKPAGLSLDLAFRSIIQKEVEAQMMPLQLALAQLQSLSALANRLSPLASLLGGGTHTLARRGPGRPARVAVLGRGKGSGGVLARSRGCAIIGCKRPSRTKGYCAAHYQKLRMLTRSTRRPSDWVDFADPSSVADVVLPRGRAAHKSRRQEA